MEKASSESSEAIFHAFNKGEYQVVSDLLSKIMGQAEASGNDDEVEAATKQVAMVNILLEYFKDGAKDPKKAYKALQEIDNGDQIDENTDVNFLLEYNCGVFAYLSQMYENAFTHFKKIMKYNDDAELFLIIKSAYACLQILTDNLQVESAKVIIRKLEDLQPCLEKLLDLKKHYRSDVLSDKSNEGQKSSKKSKGLNLEYFSVA
jgi:hypothetical protein